MKGPAYLLVKASADRIPLANDSVSLVIATPPALGVKRRPKADYCTSDPEEYGLRMREFLKEATRIVQRRGHILLISSRLRKGMSRGARPIVFHVLKKRVSRGRWAYHRIKAERFLTHFVEVRNFPWWALPIRLYRTLIRRYSAPGEIIAHVFSGSGNGGIAAMELMRKPILIDLHYHRQISRRLHHRVPSIRPKIALSFLQLSA